MRSFNGLLLAAAVALLVPGLWAKAGEGDELPSSSTRALSVVSQPASRSLGRPRRGPFGRSLGGLGHASHQNGLDVEVRPLVHHDDHLHVRLPPDC